MVRRLILVLAAWLGLLSMAAPATAQEAMPELRARAEQVLALLRGQGEPSEMFTPTFLAAVPEPQLRTVVQTLVTQHGAVRAMASFEPRSPTSAMLRIEMERSVLTMSLAIEPEPPHRIAELLVTSADARAGSVDELVAELESLPGEVSFALARLGDGGPERIAALHPERALAIGSTFKLIVLAELSRQIRAGERRWSDVVALDRRSLPSGQLQSWPQGAPVTLHTLAALMISISDNTATDMLLHLVGRDNVERMMATIGIEAAARNRPFLSTLELFALKSAEAESVAAWLAADEAGRRQMLAGALARTDPDSLDPSLFTGSPRRIGELEWFASADDLVRTLDWLRRNGDPTTHGILAISPGGTAALRDSFAYVGFKGGSEPGVINLSWLIRTRGGDWYALTGGWNNPTAPVEEGRFVALMSRALQLVRESDDNAP